jgi:hypothetical protein
MLGRIEGKAMTTDKMRADLERQYTMCFEKRNRLLRKARVKELSNKLLSFTSGVLALLSGLCATTIFAELTNSLAVKIVTAILIFLSGLISLMTGLFSDQKEISQMFVGAGEFLLLRERISTDLYRTDMTETQLIAVLKKYGEEYGKLSMKYDRFTTGVRYSSRRTWGDVYTDKLSKYIVRDSESD